MDPFEYISEFLNTPNKKMDYYDDVFLRGILTGFTSAYKLFTFLEKEGRHQIAYKNVHRRVHKMLERRLIEEVTNPNGNKHGAINYKLTSRGLIYVFSQGIAPAKLHEVIIKYPLNSLFKFFIYCYFEKETIKRSTATLTSLLEHYLEEACQIIRSFIDIKLEDALLSFGGTYSDPDEITKAIVNYPLEWHKRSFVLKVATLKDELIAWHNQLANDKQETLDLLAKDKKFMSALEKYGGEFLEGYEKLILLRNKQGNK